MDRILLIDDDRELCELLDEYLAGESLDVDAVYDGASGLDKALSGGYDLAIVDVMLPGITGLEVLRQLRSAGGPAAQLPILMLTARGDDVDRIVGLELGADDYLPKPFNPRELVARIGAILRRSRCASAMEDSGEHIRIGDLEVDIPSRSATCAGLIVELTTAEFDILAALLRSAGRVLSRDEIAAEVFHRRTIPFDRSIDMHISNLRKKLGQHPGHSDRIKAIRGVGYTYARPAPQN